jgi:hypothetical protein
VEFGLRFESQESEDDGDDDDDDGAPMVEDAGEEDGDGRGEAEVVSLDRFRK